MRTLTQPLNMSPGGIPPVIHVSQYDSDFTIVFTLFSTVGDFTIEAGTTAMVRGTKSSGTGYSADAAINISAKTVTVTGNAQMTAAAGQNVFEITLLKSGKEISSKNFILLCERAALDADTITDESVLKELNAIIESADTATQAAEEAEDAADRAEAAAQTFVIDSTLTKPRQAADAKKVGDGFLETKSKIDGVQNEIIRTAGTIEEMECGLTEEVKTALLACFEQVVWIGPDGQTYYDALETALNKKRAISSISAVFTQGSAVVYDTDELYSLKQYLTVTVAYDDTTTKEVSNYTLDGTLTAGTSTITVAYGKKTTTFNVAVTHQQKTLESITATLSSSATMTTDNVLDDLRPYLTVRATYSDGSTQTVSNYTLNGSMNVGANTITVTYSGKTATFTVNVTQAEKTLQSISTVFNQGSAVIYTTSSLDDLKPYLTVTARYSDGTTQTVTNYTLSGTLTKGTSTITASYGGKTATFDVHAYYPRVLTADDIESNSGISVTIDASGTPTHVSTASAYYALLFKPYVTKIKAKTTEWLDNSHFTIAVEKDGDNVYGIDPGTVNQYVPTERCKLTLTSSRDGYGKESDYTDSVIKDFTPNHDWPNVFIGHTNEEILIELLDGKVVISDIENNEICSINVPGANRLGYWGSYYLIGTYLTNISVLEG